MKVEGTKEFNAPAQLVWDVLNDPSKMAKLLPGVESFEIQDERRWKASVKIPLGMGGLKLNFQFEKMPLPNTDQSNRKGSYYSLKAKVGSKSQTVSFTLAPSDFLEIVIKLQ